MAVEKNKLTEMRHSTEHVLHTAMQKLYPQLLKAMGPATEEGFYFDFDPSAGSGQVYKINEEDFPKIEAEMQKLKDSDLPITQEYISLKRAKEIFKGNPYKMEWIASIEKRGERVSIYKIDGQDLDLCSGPHVSSTGKIGFFKLLSVAGAYWHGDEKNKMLTRIYGTSFPTQEELDEYLTMHDEAKKRDHRKLGKTLDLFTFSDLVGAGLPLYTPKGALIRKLLNDYVEGVQSKNGYQQVWTNQFAKAELYKISGHYDKYKENMFKVFSNYSDEEFYLKPMNCPQHTQIYASKPRSYKDLPLRYTDFAMLYRDEKPGELNGLARVRSFSQDDCHIFCKEDQVDKEIDTALSMIKEIMKTFGFKYRYRLSTRDTKHPEKYLGDPETWDKVEKWAVKIMKRNKIDYFDGPGEAAFYAPKMDLMATDALGREWQLSTVQIDYVMPERFNLEYTDKDGSKKHPIMLHRAILGSTERFIMILLEHFAGSLPLWLSPTQVKILPISSRHIKYAEKIFNELKSIGIRLEIDDRNATLPGKIRDAELEKIPYMLVLGDKEEKLNNVSVRLRNEKDLGQMSLKEFMKRINHRIEIKSLDL